MSAFAAGEGGGPAGAMGGGVSSEHLTRGYLLLLEPVTISALPTGAEGPAANCEHPTSHGECHRGVPPSVPCLLHGGEGSCSHPGPRLSLSARRSCHCQSPWRSAEGGVRSGGRCAGLCCEDPDPALPGTGPRETRSLPTLLRW